MARYVTTEWAIIFLLPVVPLRSVRVWEKQLEVSAFSSRQTFGTLPVPLCWRQVLCVWGFMLFCLAWGCGIFFSGMLSYGSKFALPALALAPAVIPISLRWKRRRRIRMIRQHIVDFGAGPVSLRVLFKEGRMIDRLKILGAIGAGLAVTGLIIFLVNTFKSGAR
jgi:hypothetical protein